MLLHHYSTQAAVEALWTNELKITSPCDFNDPFEFLPATKKISLENRRYCKNFQQSSKNRIYVLSMSARKNNGRMWAQYGENHTGFIITLNFKKQPLAKWREHRFLHKVDYSQSRRHIITPGKETIEDFTELLTRKGRDWDHEKEWRLLFTPDFPDLQYRMFKGQLAAFLPLPDQAISAVTLGHRSTNALAASVFKIKEIHGAKWTIRKAKWDDYKFSLGYETIPD